MHTNKQAQCPLNPALARRKRMMGRFHLGYALPFLVLAAALAITHQLWQNEQRNAMQVLQTDFDSRVREAGSRVEQRMAAYGQVMRGVDGLFAHAGIVERDEFHDYIARLRLKENYPGIQCIRFAPIVPQAQKNKHIAAMRKQGLAEYTIHPEGERDFYTPVIYAEPYDERNQVIFGYDTYSDRESPRPGNSEQGLRRAAMEQARDTGQATLSGKIRLLFETDQGKQAGFLMFLPVYRHDAPHGTLAERRANIIGWISSVFRMNDLMDGIFGERGSELDTNIYDGEEMLDKTLMYDSDRGGGVHDLSARFHSVRRFEVAGRTWVVKIYSLPGFEALLDKGKPQFIATVGIGASLLLALITLLLVHGRMRALQASREISLELNERKQAEQALTETQEMLRTLVDTAMDAVVIMDSDGTITGWNNRAENIFGWTRGEAVGRALHETIILPRYREAHVHGLKHFMTSGEGPLLNSRIDISALHRDGHEFPIELSVTPIKTAGKYEFSAFIRDITERKQAEEWIHKHLAQTQAVARLSEAVSHAEGIE